MVVESIRAAAGISLKEREREAIYWLFFKEKPASALHLRLEETDFFLVYQAAVVLCSPLLH